MESLLNHLESLGRACLRCLRQIGEFFLFNQKVWAWMFARPFRRKNIFQHMEFIGVKSLPIVALTGTFSGMVFALQTGYSFRQFNAEGFVGSTVGLALTREIGPVFTALMVVARAGSAMAAEIGTMKVTEQIDALFSMAVNPIHFLVVPRVIAAVIMVPLLSGLFSIIGIVGAYFIAVHLLDISGIVFLNKLYYYVDAVDLLGGLFKSAVFAYFLALISCQRGYQTRGGAQGVGQATTQAVVISSVTILVLDYFLTSWILAVT